MVSVEIKKIRLRDFRQFRGDQFIKFATDKVRNVTPVHAENGVGKTTESSSPRSGSRSVRLGNGQQDAQAHGSSRSISRKPF
jgi:hypothetical protein